MLISVVLTTYNSPRPLSASLHSFKNQTDDGFEVVVADDGSTHETRNLIESLELDVPYPLHHVRQEDGGFCVARARNLAFARTSGEYIVFVDGDCFVLPDFVAAQRQLAESGYFVSGKRSWLREDFTRRWLDNPSHDGRLVWFSRALRNKCTRPLEFVPRQNGNWRYRRHRDWQGVQTCNLGVWRDDAVAVNGFDNRYQGPGLEDSDFVVRLIRRGIWCRHAGIGGVGGDIVLEGAGERDEAGTTAEIKFLNEHVERSRPLVDTRTRWRAEEW